MNPTATEKKCIMCENKAWIISNKTDKPIYCRKCYIEIVNKCKDLENWCLKCGNKKPICKNKNGTCLNDVLTCYGCWFERYNVTDKSTIKYFFEYLKKSKCKDFSVSDAMNTFFEFDCCSCVFSNCSQCKC